MIDVDRRVRQLGCDGVIAESGILASGVVGIFLVPIMLKGLGAELYGLLIATLAVAGSCGAAA